MSRLVRAIAILCIVAFPGVCAAQDAIVIVRHAERADASAAGEACAERLAAVLKDAGITQIYTTDLQRTIQTDAPLASALHLTAAALKAGDQGALLARLHAASARDRILVVGHSNTVPPLLDALGVTPAITVTDAEYDNLFVVIPQPGQAPRLLRLRF